METKSSTLRHIAERCEEAKKETESVLRDCVHDCGTLETFLEKFLNGLRATGYDYQVDQYIRTLCGEKGDALVGIGDSLSKAREEEEDLIRAIERHGEEMEEIDDLPRLKESCRKWQGEYVDRLRTIVEEIETLESVISDLRHLARFDPLTKLLNRRALEEDLEKLFDAAKGREMKLCAIMVDVDDFKGINDRHTHAAGDKVLVYLGKLLRSVTRDGDRAYRYGGEEFLIIARCGSEEDAKALAERLIRAIRKNRLFYRTQELRLTVSVGITMHRADDDPASFVARADEALFEAKRLGKDRYAIR